MGSRSKVLDGGGGKPLELEFVAFSLFLLFVLSSHDFGPPGYRALGPGPTDPVGNSALNPTLCTKKYHTYMYVDLYHTKADVLIAVRKRHQ